MALSLTQFLLDHLTAIVSLALLAIHGLGVISAFDAVFLARSSQSAIAWGLCLVMFPYLSLPAYWVFGRRRFRGYTELQRKFSEVHKAEFTKQQQLFRKFYAARVPIDAESERALEKIAQDQFTDHNSVKLLINGEETFAEIINALDAAKKYIFIQFYIFRADDLGIRLQELLISKALEGLQVLFLYDEVGSSDIPETFLSEMQEAGIECRPFATRQGLGNFFQFNFRNHRKSVVIDGKTAFVGGHNVGTEYLGQSKRFGFWRDTHVRIDGPAAIPIQSIFLADWAWASQMRPDFEPSAPELPGNMRVLSIGTGPADEEPRCLLWFLEIINMAKSRLWISSPYFVPDDSLIHALHLAALRGVDVRLLIPQKPDHLIVWLASFSYIPEIIRLGVKVFAYHNGFLHQKAFLVDDTLAGIGTVNMDNRSLRLNFEIMTLIADRTFGLQVAQMFERDFEQSDSLALLSFESVSFVKRLAARFARLFSPIL
jgi:cardiolipin synthase